MKKSLVIALAIFLGASATAWAANPFSALPAEHWVYASVAKLAASGIIEGYPDGTFKGDNLMTRYEMAQIVAKAYAKGGIGDDDRLMTEFAEELASLGVRTTSLEKKSDNTKITGEARMRYADVKGPDKMYLADLRTRLWLSGEGSSDWRYVAMLENMQSFNTNKEESETKFRRAYVTGNAGDVKVTGGRYNYTVGQGNVFDEAIDGVQIDFGKVLKASMAYGRPAGGNDFHSFKDAGGNTVYTKNNDAFITTLDYKTGIFAFNAAFYNFLDYVGNADNKIWTVGGSIDVSDNIRLHGEYLKSNFAANTDDDDGIVFGLNYKGAEPKKKGSYCIWAKYYNQDRSTYVAHTTDAVHDSLWGFEGYGVGVDYTITKNIVALVEYFNFDGKYNEGRDKTLWSDVTFTF
ncbi:MAG: S-layer homology domain-containing protein [Acholeplasmataceae bacterium]|nr:S-layer homology domain-containing protein [Acholeplasmataceae bacterium]